MPVISRDDVLAARRHAKPPRVLHNPEREISGSAEEALWIGRTLADQNSADHFRGAGRRLSTSRGTSRTSGTMMSGARSIASMTASGFVVVSRDEI